MGSEATQRQRHSHPLAFSALSSMKCNAWGTLGSQGFVPNIGSGQGKEGSLQLEGPGFAQVSEEGAYGQTEDGPPLSGVRLPLVTSQLHPPQKGLPERGCADCRIRQPPFGSRTNGGGGARLGPEEVACRRSQQSRPGASKELQAWKSSKQPPDQRGGQPLSLPRALPPAQDPELRAARSPSRQHSAWQAVLGSSLLPRRPPSPVGGSACVGVGPKQEAGRIS